MWFQRCSGRTKQATGDADSVEDTTFPLRRVQRAFPDSMYRRKAGQSPIQNTPLLLHHSTGNREHESASAPRANGRDGGKQLRRSGTIPLCTQVALSQQVRLECGRSNTVPNDSWCQVIERRRTARIMIEELEYEYKGIPHSLRFTWRYSDRDSGEVLDHRIYIFSPGLGLAAESR